MPGKERIRQEIMEIVADVADVPPGEVSASASLEELGVDSLRGLRIVAQVEKRYGVVIPEEKIGLIRTMEDIFRLVDEHAPAEG